MKILIADDEPIIRLGLKSMLQGMGHEVTSATNGSEAVQMVSRYPFDLAILDIKMPYTDGLQATRLIAKKHPLPIILLTAFSEQDLVEQASDLPIQGYLVKPVRPEQLSATIAVAHKRFMDEQANQQAVEQLNEKLANQKLVNRAKAKLIKQGLTEAEAYAKLQATARQTRQPIHIVARKVLKTK